MAAGTGGAGSAKSAPVSSNCPSASGILAMVASDRKLRRSSQLGRRLPCLSYRKRKTCVLGGRRG